MEKLGLRPDVEHLTQNLKTTVARFQNEPTPENFAQIITSLSAFGLTGQDLWHEAVEYTKKYPVRVAFFVGIMFYALKGIVGSKSAPTMSNEELH